MKYKYIVEEGTPYVVQMPEMEKPNDIEYMFSPFSNRNELYEQAIEAYNKHIASLPKYELSVEIPDWVGREDLEEGKDFVLVKEVCLNHGEPFIKATDALYNSIKEKYRRIIAIPILPNKSTEQPRNGMYGQQEITEQEKDAIAFVRWLDDNTIIIREDDIVLYRYRDRDNQMGNYTLEDIYTEFKN
ncbi:MAG TPA: hypothetical protein VMY77_14525 [Chitinophagaceae bacterium]|nr:hypothetical protein [Chitinophagaceae bacterium]